MSKERIITMHPQGEPGANLPQDLYEKLKEAILMPFLLHSEIKEQNLVQRASGFIKEDLGEKKAWHIEVVKQDLLARDAIEYIPEASEKTLRLKIIIC